ncbi:protein SOSEKI 2-like [Andrographis paniculata]|uniref:protein SOSEKI 2-like n=1 Tax=Andrographis paniculata TaxID=175694 RepID=UPI0021E9193D|nr:protein SOSEKI 2-like [Andrographis paniculata]
MRSDSDSEEKIQIQVVYYLSRNGLLDHPHYMEFAHHHTHPTLKDVMERLTQLRGKAIPSLYSWSCKRSYKNGYVWNDLAEDDLIFPSEGGEYVLKGSEILLTCTEKLQCLQLQLKQDPSFHPKRKLLLSKRHPPQQHKIPNNQHEEEEEEDGTEKQTSKSCSRGVSTDEIEELNTQTPPQSEHVIDADSSPPSARSENSSNTLDALNPTRFEDGDPIGIEPMLSRNSMLLSLIACGGSSSFRKSFPSHDEIPARKSCSGASLHKAAVLKAAAAAATTTTTEKEEEDEIMIRYMSENPRLIGNFPAEEKEYFSGSIVEAMGDDVRLGRDQRPRLKRSSSFNQDRSDTTREAAAAAAVRKELNKEKSKMKGKCLPRKKTTSSSKKKFKIQALH